MFVNRSGANEEGRSPPEGVRDPKQVKIPSKDPLLKITVQVPTTSDPSRASAAARGSGSDGEIGSSLRGTVPLRPRQPRPLRPRSAADEQGIGQRAEHILPLSVTDAQQKKHLLCILADSAHLIPRGVVREGGACVLGDEGTSGVQSN
jgi:hypothetical protein